MGEQGREGRNDLVDLNIWWNLNRLRDPLKKSGQINPTPYGVS
jgi:hypothetical protein